MDKEKVLIITEKVKAVCIGFIGAGIFSQGTLYFQEQSEYNVPRILYPIYELFGNVGLAVGMIIIGLGLIYFGFTRWKKANGNSNQYRLIGAASIMIFGAILYFANKPKEKQSAEIIKANSDKAREIEIEKIRNMEKPDFQNVEIDKYFAEYDSLLGRYTENLKSKNDTAIEKNTNDLAAWSMKMSNYYTYIEENDQKAKFALYVGKLSMKWQEMN